MQRRVDDYRGSTPKAMMTSEVALQGDDEYQCGKSLDLGGKLITIIGEGISALVFRCGRRKRAAVGMLAWRHPVWPSNAVTGVIGIYRAKPTRSRLCVQSRFLLGRRRLYRALVEAV